MNRIFGGAAAGKVFAATLMSAALAGTPVAHTNATTAEVQRRTTDQKTVEPVATEPVRKQKAFGGFKVYNDPGIPPHIYGQHHVRSGTHKRTNK